MENTIWSDDPEIQRILDERARILSQQDVSSDAEEGEEVLVFRLGEGRYALPARFVHEVQPLVGSTPLPATPPFIVGLVNVRGKILTALDIRPLLDIPQEPLVHEVFLLIISAHGLQVGVLADMVVEVRHGEHDLAPALSTTAGRGVPWIRGVDHDLNLLIDPVLLLSDPRMMINTEPDQGVNG